MIAATGIGLFLIPLYVSVERMREWAHSRFGDGAARAAPKAAE
jgi:hypothetical protein